MSLQTWSLEPKRKLAPVVALEVHAFNDFEQEPELGVLARGPTWVVCVCVVCLSWSLQR